MRAARVNHMHLVDAQKAIQQFAATGARYLLTNAAVPEAHKLQDSLHEGWLRHLHLRIQVHEDVDNFVGAEKTCHTILG